MAKKEKEGGVGTVKRILIYGNRKVEPTYWDASTEELEAGAYLALFRLLDESWKVYAGLKEEPYQPEFPKDHPEGCMCEGCKTARQYRNAAPKEKRENQRQLELYRRAKKGEAVAAKALLHMRKDYEYEEFSFDFVESETSSYPARTWGLPGKPCGTAYVHESGLVRWGNHNEMTYSFSNGLKKAVDRLTGDRGVLHYDVASKEEVTIEEAWDLSPFRAQKPGETDESYACAMLGCESEDAEAALKLLKKGSFLPGRVLKFHKQVCPSCRREWSRFEAPTRRD